MWYAEFYEMGGYDCMTGAWTIYDENRKVIAVIDLGSYGQKHCDYDFRSEEAEKNAKLIVEAVNSRLSGE